MKKPAWKKNRVVPQVDLDGFEWTKFPVELCVKKTKEPGILEAEKDFVCVLVHRDNHAKVEIRILRPYTWTSDDEVEGCPQTFFGWTDSDKNPYSHGDDETSVHHDDERVVAWKQVTRE